MQKPSKILTITLTGKPPIKVDTKDWPIVAASTNQADGPIKPQHKLTIRGSSNQIYLIYSVAYPQPGTDAKPQRAGETVYGLKAIPETAYRVGKAVGMTDTEVRTVIEKLPPIDESLNSQADGVIFLENAAVALFEIKKHTETDTLEHVSLTAFAPPGSGIRRQFTQLAGDLQKFYSQPGYFLEETDKDKFLAGQVTQLWSAVARGQKNVELKTTAGTHTVEVKDAVQFLGRVTRWAKKPLACPPYKCAHCTHMHLNTDEVGSEASYGAFYCHVTEDAGMFWDAACPSFQKDDSPERQAELQKWQKEGHLGD